MVTFSDSTVFNTPAQTIVNTVNCVGVMGTGLALEFRLRYPKMYEDYIERCARNSVQIGTPYLYREFDGVWILNFPTKYHWKMPSKIDWIELGLNYFVENYKNADVQSIAFPKLGSGNGGLPWDEVKNMMIKYLSTIPIHVTICLDVMEVATGTEGNMVRIVNESSEEELAHILGNRQKQISSIIENRPFKRFFTIKALPGIGQKAYERLWSFSYNRSISELGASPVITQLKLF